MRELAITVVPISTLRPHERNARTHSKSQVRQIVESMTTMGWTSPILVDDTNRIIAGHARLDAAKLLGLTEVPVIRLTDRTEAQRRAYCLADNKLAENAGWDLNIVRLEFEEIIRLESSFDLSITGFSFGQIDLILDKESPARADCLPEVWSSAPPVNYPGDLWLLGSHRLLCGDARDRATYAKLMNGKTAQMVFTDPPWNLPIEGNVGGLGSVKHEDFAMACGEMSEPQSAEFLVMVIVLLIQHSANGTIHFIAIDWRHVYDLMTAARGRYAELKNLCVWNKTNGGMGSFCRSKHELILVFKNGPGDTSTISSSAATAGIGPMSGTMPESISCVRGGWTSSACIPPVKPVALVADAIKDCSKRRGIVLDPFCGSGSTLIAAELTGRSAYALEIEPRYVDTAIRRWQDFTGEPARHAESGETFNDLRSKCVRRRRSSRPGITALCFKRSRNEFTPLDRSFPQSQFARCEGGSSEHNK